MHLATRFVHQLTHLAKTLASGNFRSRVAQEDEAISDAEIETMFNADLCSHLAALPRAYLELVPPDLAELIRRAKAFHKVMDTRGAEQEAELAAAEIGFHPRHHVRLRLGPHTDKYLAVPTTMLCEYASKDLEARVERAQIRLAGCVVIDVFGNKVPTESQIWKSVS